METKQTVKIKGRNVYLNGELVGERSFTRSRYPGGVEINGYFIFTVDNIRYRYDTSCFGYCRDADNYIRRQLRDNGLHGFINQSTIIK